MKAKKIKYIKLIFALGAILGVFHKSDAQTGQVTKHYELKNHQGNVLVVVSNEKDEDGNAVVISAMDYYPFGMAMPGRVFNSHEYRYGFNGKEKDDEVRGAANSYDFGSRNIYDPRVGRFVSTDPRWREFASYSPYAYAANSPMVFLDENGEGPIDFRFKGWLSEDSNYLTGMVAGVGDGVVETADLVAGVVRAKAAWDVTSLYYYSDDAKKIRNEHMQMARTALNVATNSELRSKIYSSIEQELGQWWGELTFEGTEAQAGYQHGKVVFEALTSLVGVKEVKVLLETGEFSAKALGKIAAERARRMKPCGCFMAGTLVLTAQGHRSIEAVMVGDQVWAYNDSTKALSLKKVANTFTREWDEIFKIQIGNETLKVTNEHPFFINGKWIIAEDLNEGDTLTTYDNSIQTIKKIKIIEGDFKVFNFTVEDDHTYYVSNYNVLVHNGNPCFKSAEELSGAVTEFVGLQRALKGEKISAKQFKKFNTATVVYDRSTGKYYYGMNGGIDLGDLPMHKTLKNNLPKESLEKYKLGNCAECDAVNKALHNGANWGDLQMHTIGVRPDGSTFNKTRCKNCLETFHDMRVTSDD